MARNGGIKGGQITVSATTPAPKSNVIEQQLFKDGNQWQVVLFYQDYATPGTYTFIVPNGASTISYMAIGGGGSGDNGNSGDGGGGGGGGGGCAWASGVAVSPGDQLTVVVGAGGLASTLTTYSAMAAPGGNSSVTLVQSGKTDWVITAYGGGGGKPFSYTPGSDGSPYSSYTVSAQNDGVYAGGTNKVVGGYNGGRGGGAYDGGGGGGGAGGAQGIGGAGRGSLSGREDTNITPGTTGGGGGGAYTSGVSASGGGQNGGTGYSNITGGGGGGSYTYSSTYPATAGGDGVNSTSAGNKGGTGGFPGGGGGGSWDNGTGVGSDGGNGFVRIVWGTNGSGQRKFPDNAGDE